MRVSVVECGPDHWQSGFDAGKRSEVKWTTGVLREVFDFGGFNQKGASGKVRWRAQWVIGQDRS